MKLKSRSEFLNKKGQLQLEVALGIPKKNILGEMPKHKKVSYLRKVKLSILANKCVSEFY